MTLSVKADLPDESNSSEMRLFRIAGSEAFTLGSEAFGCIGEVGGVIGD